MLFLSVMVHHQFECYHNDYRQFVAVRRRGPKSMIEGFHYIVQVG